MRRGLVAGAFLLCVVSAFAGDVRPVLLAQNGQPAAPPAANSGMQTPAPGDHWTYEVKDEISGAIKETRKVMVTDVSKNEIAIHVDFVNSGRSSNIVYDSSWNVLRDNAGKFTPNDGSGVKLPLALNAQWKFSANEINSGTGASWKVTGDSRVVGQEIVTMKAGQFETFVIDSHSVVRNTKDTTRISDFSTRTWFSLDVNHWVKRTIVTRQDGHIFQNQTVALIEYGRKQQ
jgi:hypothetical protein